MRCLSFCHRFFLLLLLSLAFSLLAFTGCDSGGGAKVEPPPDPLTVAWKHAYDIAGGVRLAPKPVGDSLVLFGAEARLVALRTADGSVKWQSPRVEPATLEMKCFELRISSNRAFGSHVGRAMAWSLESGKELWTFDPESNFYDIGYYGLGPNYFYANGDGKLLMIDRQDGSLVRKREYGAAGITYHDGYLYLSQAWVPEGAQGQAQGGILKVDAATGDTSWFFKTQRGGFYDMRPIVKDSVVYAGTHGGKGAFFALNAQTGEEIWRNTDAYTYAATHRGDRIYINDSANIQALDKETGRTLWKTDVPGGSGFAGLAYLKGYVYHPRGGSLYVFDAQTGEIVHVEPSPSGYFWTISAGTGKVFAQSSGHLIAYESYQPE